MKQTLLFFSAIFYLSAAGQQISIHQEQAEHYGQFSHFTEHQFDSLNGIPKYQAPGIKVPPCNLNKIVFGWFPYWQGTTYNNFQWDKLSDLSYFSYEVDPATGNASTTHGWSTANVVTVAQQNGVRVNLCVTLFSSHSTFFGSSTAQQTLISNLISLVQQRNANGVNIDFEGVPSSQKAALTNFMINLCNQMHAAIPNSQVSIALYSVDWNGVFDIPALNPYVDLFIIMGYDYYYGGSTTAGPNDPLYHFGSTYNYTLSKSITYYLKQGVSPGKLILGLPWYGREYTTTSGTVPSSVLNPPNSVTRTFTTVMLNTSGNYTNSNKYWEGDSFSPYWMFQSGGNWKQCFVDDAYSMRKRFDIVNQRGIGGIGIWALGYDDGYSDYWDALKDKFTDCGSIPCSDTIYDGGGPNKNYYDNENYSYTIAPAGANSVSLVFSSFDVEANFDTLWLFDGPNTSSPLIGAYTGTNSPGTVNSSGSTLTYRFKSDVSTTRPGWNAIWTCTTAPLDNTPPTTTAAVTGNWQTQNFTTAFSDADNVSVAERFFQVLDWNGSEWRGNGANGFFNDNFSASLNAEWTNAGGTWAIASGFLNQSDEVNGNTNIYSSANQTASYSYLFHWQMRMGGTGTNRRAGLHFFSDNSSLPNRGNGYFVYFRVDNQKAQIYKVVNDAFTLESDVAYAFAANTFYDFKTTFNPSSGEIKVFVNDVFVSSWTDASPITSGNSISLRTGNCTADYNDVKVYRSRAASEVVSVGNSSADVRYQNPDPSTPSCRIKSLVVDGSENWSSAATLNVNVDWTAPVDVVVNDGSLSDIDTTNINTELTANWTASADTHSAVAAYRYAIGTSQGATDVVNWVNNGMGTSVTHTGLSLSYGTTYYFSVQVENGAGLLSNEIYSDGQLLIQPLPPPTASFSTANNTVCSGEMINFQNTSTDADSFAWSFPGGNPSVSSASNPAVSFDSSGSYNVTLIAYATGNSTSDTLTQNVSVTVNPSPAAAFSGDSTSVYLPNATVNFTNSSADATSYLWDFGDGSSTSSVPGPSHTYADTGYYSITLIAMNGLCDNDTLVLNNYIHVIDTIVAYPSPTAVFTTSLTTVCTGDYISFNNNSTNAISYQWAFSGGTPAISADANPSVIYDSSGIYSVTLIATGQGGTDTVTQAINITVNAVPSANFSTTDTIVYLPNGTVNFSNSSTDATSFLWNFGDGTPTSSVANPSHTYNDTGYYTVTLIAMNGNCPDDVLSITDYIYVNDTTTATPLPAAGFSVSSTYICTGDSTAFMNTSANATSYEWLFPGGVPSASISSDPMVIYDSSGTYTVTLIATGPGGTDTLTQTVNITVNPLPVAAFSANTTTVYLPNATVSFSNTSANSTSFQWDFGDGTSTSSVSNPSHTYADSGFYTITLVASNGLCNNDTFTITDYVHVMDTTTTYPAPVADFTTSATNICAGQTISFSNTSTDAVSFEWTFAGGTPATSTSPDPTVVYDSSGTYTVTLIATGLGGTDTLAQTVTITVNPLPVAAFSANTTTVYLPNAMVSFSNTSANSTSFQWDFGDGTSTSSVSNPSHTYADTGFYTVTLISSNGLCDNDTFTITDYIHVLDTSTINPAPVAGFTTSATNVCTGQAINFTNTSTNATSYEWLFPGGTPNMSTNQNPPVVYSVSGMYNVILTATGPGGTDTLQQFISVSIYPAPMADFTAVDTTVSLPNAFVAFSNNSSNASGYLWDFGDGTTSTAINPWHTYNDSGYFSVTLVAFGNNCPNDTLTMINYIYVGGLVGEGEWQISDVGFQIFPNPGKGIFILKKTSETEQEMSICIYNASGDIIYRETGLHRTISVDISKQPKGIYFLRITSGDRVSNTNLIIQ